jgi:hypothetical protein
MVLMTLNLHALVQCIMMQGLRWKWLDHFHSLWLRSIQLNWTEGTFDFSPLHFTMHIVRVAQNAYQPLAMVPLGTFMFLGRWRAHRRRQNAAISQFDCVGLAAAA